jgi:hypothetical protein
VKDFCMKRKKKKLISSYPAEGRRGLVDPLPPPPIMVDPVSECPLLLVDL